MKKAHMVQTESDSRSLLCQARTRHPALSLFSSSGKEGLFVQRETVLHPTTTRQSNSLNQVTFMSQSLPLQFFLTPTITTEVINDDVLNTWRTLTLLLPAWNEKFFIATTASSDVPASSAAMEVHETFYHTKALNFKTPAKRKRSTNDLLSSAPSLLDVSVYSPFFKDDKVAPITDIDHISGVLARLDGGITANNAAIINFIDDYKGEHGKAGNSI
jgi:hypothetical protein